jgi:hypothetical protein
LGKKIYTFRGKKSKNKPLQSKNGICARKTEYWLENKFLKIRKNKPPEPKNGIWAPNSVWSCDISIDQEFYMVQDKIYF